MRVFIRRGIDSHESDLGGMPVLPEPGDYIGARVADSGEALVDVRLLVTARVFECRPRPNPHVTPGLEHIVMPLEWVCVLETEVSE